MLEIAHEPSLKYRRHGTQSHRHCGKLPEVRHQPRMGIGRQAATLDFLPETHQLAFVQPAFKVGTRIDSGTRMSLHKNHVPGMRSALGAPKMIEAHLIEGRSRGV